MMSENPSEREKPIVEDKEVSRRRFLLAGILSLPILHVAAKLLSRNQEKENSTRFLLKELFEKEPEWAIPEKDPQHPKDSDYFYNEIEVWRERYLTHPKDSIRLKEGFGRLLANDGKDLKMIYEITREKEVPFELVFLALAESHWYPYGENPWNAAGYWQFIPSTAVQYGLNNVPKGNRRSKHHSREELETIGDERLDPGKSTIAGIQYLKFLKGFFAKLAKKQEYDLDEHALWSYAMWAYNRGPGHVKKSFIRQKGNAIRYPRHLIQERNTRARRESSKYVPKIWAIRLVLQELYKKGEWGNFTPKKVEKTAQATSLEASKKITPADTMYARLEKPSRKSNDFLSPAEREAAITYLEKLGEIRQSYIEEGKQGIQNENYVAGALAEIDKAILYVRRTFPELYQTEQKNGETTKTSVDPKTGDLAITKIQKGKESTEEKIPTLIYKVKPGNGLDKLATWLSSSPDRFSEVKKLILTLNPELQRSKNRMYKWSEIEIPARRITVPNKKLTEIAKQYYPGQNPEAAAKMIKWLNHKKTINPGDKIYVPAI